MSVARACATMDRPRVRALPTRAEAGRSENARLNARSWPRVGDESTLALSAAFGFDSVDAFRAAALELDDAQLEFTCHAMHCFMQAYLENLQ
ncbi:MAG: hypothetical protein GC172_11330 [Phycisphaera sp.]|nr:hypothetical protein [Phycisphaera sp.]